MLSYLDDYLALGSTCLDVGQSLIGRFKWEYAMAADRFRSDGIAASGIAKIMSEAGLTNGAFYPHFESKAALVRETVAAALEHQSQQIREALALGGLTMAIDAYLSAEHRDNPGHGCASAALLPEIARESSDTRQFYTDRLVAQVRQVAAELPPSIEDPERVAFGIFSTLIGALQLARAVEGTALSDRVLAAGKDATRKLVKPCQDEARAEM